MITLKAHAKINLSLDVVGKRTDGYHDLRTVMQSVRLADDVALHPSKDISVKCDLKYLPQDDRNIAARAARLYLDEIGTKEGVHISIHKQIPVGGGLGGGSADAAAVLMGLNKKYHYRVPFARLAQLGLVCGADVPFCMTGGTCLAEGLGEILTPLPSLPHCQILLIRPKFPISTKSVFSKLECKKIQHHPDTAGILNALNNRDLKGVCVRTYNVLESVVTRPEIAEYKAMLLKHGAETALMTGSGSVVYGIFTSHEKVTQAKIAFAKLPVTSYLTTPVSIIF